MKKIPTNEKLDLELPDISNQISKILEKSQDIEQKLSTISMAKEYRNKKQLEKKETKFQNKNEKNNENENFEELKKNKKKIYNLKKVLKTINELKSDVSNISTRQNQMKVDLEKIRYDLC